MEKPLKFNINDFKSYFHEDNSMKKKNFKRLSEKYKINFGSVKELKAIIMYTEDLKSDINRYLRYDPVLFKYIDISGKKIPLREFFSFIKSLDKITIDHYLIEDTILYRGCNSDEKIEQIINKGRYIERGYCSSSFDKKIAENFAINLENNTKGWLIEIYAPKNTPGAFLDRYSYYPREFEFLLPRNSEFIVLEHDRSTKTIKTLFLNYL